MSLDRRTLTLQLTGLMCAVALAVGLQAGESGATAGQVYPYEVADSVQGGGCGYDYIDLEGRGAALPLTPAGDGIEADDASALVRLAQPFELYQSPRDTLVVSGNGYLAAAASLAEDDGSDFSNDCPLPGAGPAGDQSHNRIYVYHDDLRPRGDAGHVRQAFFDRCPRTGAAGIDEACTVIEWSGFERATPLRSSSPLQAQAVLYHRSHEIALQYASVDDSHAASATIGLQGMEGRAARKASCNVEMRTLPRSAVCFVDPRRRRGGGAGAP